MGLAALAGFGVAAVGSFTWGGLLTTNLKTSPTIAWSVPAMALALVAIWMYAGGWGRPGRTSAARRALLRANLVAPRAFLWAFVAGGLSLVALAGLWIVLVQISGSGGNPTLPRAGAYPAMMIALGILMGSLVSPLTEEAAFRGYSQVVLERRFSPLVAVVISSVFFALWHGPTQGFSWSKLLFFFAVGVVFGVIAYLTNSTLPAVPVHIAGDLLFFLVVWPQDSGRMLLAVHGPDLWFWLHAGQFVVFAGLALLAFPQLQRTGRRAGGASNAPLSPTPGRPEVTDRRINRRAYPGR